MITLRSYGALCSLRNERYSCLQVVSVQNVTCTRYQDWVYLRLSQSCSSDFPSLHDNLHVLFSAQTTVHHAFHQWRVSKSIFSIYSFDSPNDIVNWKPSRQSKDFKSFPGRRHDAQTSRFLHNVSFLIPNGCHFYLESKRVSLLENIWEIFWPY